MKYTGATDHTSDFQSHVKNLFHQYVIPQFEYQSRGETGFWTLTNSKHLNTILLQNFYTTFYTMNNTIFHGDSEVNELLYNVLCNYMNQYNELSVTVCKRSLRDPIGLRVTDEFTEGKKIATISRNSSDEQRVSEVDVENFDWLYGTYSGERTNLSGETDFAFTFSFRNTDEFVDYSVKGEDYLRETNSWVLSEPSTFEKLINKIS